MSTLLEKMNNIIFENLPEIEKDLFNYLNRIEEVFEFGDEEVMVFVEGHSYSYVSSIYVEDEILIVSFKGGFKKPLKELDASAILLIYEYVMMSN